MRKHNTLQTKVAEKDPKPSLESHSKLFTKPKLPENPLLQKGDMEKDQTR